MSNVVVVEGLQLQLQKVRQRRRRQRPLFPSRVCALPVPVEVVLVHEAAVAVGARKRPLARVAAQMPDYVRPPLGVVGAQVALVGARVAAAAAAR